MGSITVMWSVRMSGWLSCAVLMLSLTGCQQTPQQKLIGRWYNDEMSLRFRADGRVLLFSRSGRAEGRYVFAETQSNSAQSVSENLVMDVIRDGKARRMVFDADFLGTDRLRLSDLTPKSRRTFDPAPEFAVLRRSVEPLSTATVSK